jgi:hypothetical protein
MGIKTLPKLQMQADPPLLLLNDKRSIVVAGLDNDPNLLKTDHISQMRKVSICRARNCTHNGTYFPLRWFIASSSGEGLPCVKRWHEVT